MSQSLAAWCVLAAHTLVSLACSYFLFTEMKILSTKKMCVWVCLLCDDSVRRTGFSFFPVLQLFLVGFCCSLPGSWIYLESLLLAEVLENQSWSL